MRIVRFEHVPSGQRFLVDAAGSRVFGVAASAEAITRDDRVEHARDGVRAPDLLAAARDFEQLYDWAAPGTRFPPAPPDDAPLPEGWFTALEGRFNRQSREGDLSFHGYLDDVEQRRLE